MAGSSDTDPVVLVDDNDVEIGTIGKLEAHRRGLRHRAISALVHNSNGEFLLQRRHPAKYHSGGLWTNACCSHPLPGEDVAHAAHRRLQQEMGFDCELRPLFVLHYHIPVPGGLVENEIVHAFGGRYDGTVKPDPTEVSEWKWLPFAAMERDMRERPDAYTVWFREYVATHGKLIRDWIERATTTS